MTSTLPRAHAPHVRPRHLAAPPRVGLVNLMPRAAEFERMLTPQFAGAAPFEAVWLRVPGRTYRNDDPADLGHYVDPADMGDLDAVVITGAAVEHLPFEQVGFLGHVADVLEHASARALPVLGLCWGGLAVGYLRLGLRSHVHEVKVTGAYETDLLVADHPIGDGLDDRFWTAHSRQAGFDEHDVAAAVAAGTVRVLGRAPAPAGTVIAESTDHALLMHVGHPEYDGGRMAYEYHRDSAAGPVPLPANVSLDDPVCRWRSHSRTFLANWVELVYAAALARAGGGGTR
ncbi:homoserine O-succinyltransferase [Actinokineospora baliensis]|uniref:homoserine O-acetyltransferase/O-succinyltransferase family protein n=1 Tax=Actinokineospora baliensis TaxID=547056 RepID=UPI00195DB8A2|nr:homoserine O-succinyltransferase [Actinokineospora baliensis]MBM7773850.1 homoserine O-succinyltransferase [Actinokineospora baliensis]